MVRRQHYCRKTKVEARGEGRAHSKNASNVLNPTNTGRSTQYGITGYKASSFGEGRGADAVTVITALPVNRSVGACGSSIAKTPNQLRRGCWPSLS